MRITGAITRQMGLVPMISYVVGCLSVMDDFAIVIIDLRLISLQLLFLLVTFIKYIPYWPEYARQKKFSFV